MKKKGFHWNTYFNYVLVYVFAAFFVFQAIFARWEISILLMLCGLPVFIKKIKIYIHKKRQEKIEKDFYKLLSHISVTMSSGSSLENALKEAVLIGKKEYKVLWKELESSYRMLQNNYSPEYVFLSLAKKTDNHEIKTFSEILSVGIPAGINLARLIRWLSSAYRMRFDAESEIARILNAPKYNNRIMMIMPVVCIVLFKQIAPSYMQPLYSGAGRIVMAVVLLLVLFAWLIGDKLGDIEY